MTEYHKPNGVLPHQEHATAAANYNRQPHQEPLTLEDSISTILSTQEYTQPVLSKAKLHTAYRKAAKSFINRRFAESFAVLEEISENAVILYNNEQIKEALFLNVWSLYLNLLDILINKDAKLPALEQQKVESLYFSDELFNKLDGVYNSVHPKLMVQLLLIKLNNSATDLARLRDRMDFYLVNNRVSDEQAAEFTDFQELLEIYHVYLLAKMGEFKEAEMLIKSNPLIFKPQEMIHKLNESKKQIEEEKLQKAKLAKLKKQQELKAKQKAQELLNKRLHDAKKLEQEKKQKKLLDNNLSQTKDLKDDDLVARFISVIKAKLATNKSIGLVFVISLISFCILLQKNRWLLNAKVRRYIQQMWEKIFSTFKMAFSITYL